MYVLSVPAPMPTAAPTADPLAPLQQHLPDTIRCGVRLITGERTPIPLLLPQDRQAELLRGVATCAVPNVPRWFIGLANLRGDLVPVFDLLGYHGLAAAPERRIPDLLVIGRGATAFALPTTSEPEVLRLRPALGAPPAPKPLFGLIHKAWSHDDAHWYDFDFDRWLRQLAGSAQPGDG